MEASMLKFIPLLMVGFGGALGAMARFGVREFLPMITGTTFPLATLIVNVLGCFTAGALYAFIEHSGVQWEVNKLAFIFVGFLGAFTTFSAFALDSLVLFNQGENFKLALNILANCLLCLICVFFGAWLGGRMANS